MVLEYLHRAAFFHDSPKQYNVDKGQQYDGPHERRLSKSSQPQSLLSPVVRILKISAEVVNNAALQVRDGLTEEQRAVKKKREERKQILHLRLKNVGSSSGITRERQCANMSCYVRPKHSRTGKLQLQN